MAGRANRRISFDQQDGSAAEAWMWILKTEQLIEEMKAAPCDSSIERVQKMLEGAGERKRRSISKAESTSYRLKSRENRGSIERGHPTNHLKVLKISVFQPSDF